MHELGKFSDTFEEITHQSPKNNAIHHIVVLNILSKSKIMLPIEFAPTYLLHAHQWIQYEGGCVVSYAIDTDYIAYLNSILGILWGISDV